MKACIKPCHIMLALCLLHAAVTTTVAAAAPAAHSHSTMHVHAASPPVWPRQFVAILLQNRKNLLSLTELWYDFDKGRNMNLIQSQLDLRGTLYDLELDNRTSYYYNKEAETCRTIDFPVGILRPDWLDGAGYLGQSKIHNISVDGFTKADGFITYFAEVEEPHRPVQWRFFDGAVFDVLIWKEGATVSDDRWAIPGYCFNNSLSKTTSSLASTGVVTLNSYFRELQRRSVGRATH